jgi:hypothetical protein
MLWFVPYFNLNLPEWMLDYQIDQFIIIALEIMRRAMWATLRIENENCNNFERYRHVLQIPDINDEAAVVDIQGKKSHH